MHPDLICFSHLRWDFVFQRPNHLMSRAARDRRVLYVEEPVHQPGVLPRMELAVRDGVEVLTPHLPEGCHGDAQQEALRSLVEHHLAAEGIERPVLWYYTPMALPWTEGIDAAAIVYDCMDHLAGFRGAPPELLDLEARLIARADLLLSGGARLHGLKRRDHANAHCFPSSIDTAHFGRARRPQPEPADLASIPHPRIGYVGVIDERLDLGLIAALADAQPDWNVVLVGPVAKIDEGDIPVRPNIHRLGARSYDQLPAYLSAWDAAIMPFAHNDATAYISPTKTPEYLAAGLPVASTSIHDVVQPYGRERLVEIGDGEDGFVEACRSAMATDRADLRRRADAFLAQGSWDATWSAISELLERAVRARTATEARPATPAMPASRTRFLLPAPERTGLPTVASLASRTGAKVGAAGSRVTAAGQRIKRHAPHLPSAPSSGVEPALGGAPSLRTVD
ncbi:MAG: glycosyltransferase family 1 protein [Chloroflexota bacterium]